MENIKACKSWKANKKLADNALYRTNESREQSINKQHMIESNDLIMQR